MENLANQWGCKKLLIIGWLFGLNEAILTIAGLAFISAGIIQIRMNALIKPPV